MSGNQPPDDVPPDTAFPMVGDYVVIPGPGDAGYLEEPAPDLIEYLSDDELTELFEEDDPTEPEAADQDVVEEADNWAPPDETDADDFDGTIDEDPDEIDDAGG